MVAGLEGPLSSDRLYQDGYVVSPGVVRGWREPRDARGQACDADETQSEDDLLDRRTYLAPG